MEPTVLITGSAGLVGSALTTTLRAHGHRVLSLDLRDPDPHSRVDVRDAQAVHAAVLACTGIVHLAAVSRVIWGERDPGACRATNIDGTRNLLDAALAAPHRPWLIFASSREVYGQPRQLPATEDTPLDPINVYGHTKVAGERMLLAARDQGLRGAIVRLSNVYGSRADHHDRVVPAFVRAAVSGQPLRVDGADHTFDFTHVDDTARGIAMLANHLENGQPPPPPIQFLTGTPTTLGQLAALTVELAGTQAPITHAPPRSYDVAQFHGSPERARQFLDWSPRISLRDGLTRFIAAVRTEIGGAT
ncbi:NAD(P)-dependent oxidoreductase [Nannocystis sp.]|uniref:NAD-dependent epimerase/dehydratase family protein n=1 Tax=Nannocystis sp. TaxID=1962667 RepID=UPI0025DC536F|nr:NAD(P)-dependent oxidoreductase [Nannocystis sp.]MBK7829732.1 NAD(P)-dependent oxidoreductase [Nannocystis sp.]